MKLHYCGALLFSASEASAFRAASNNSELVKRRVLFNNIFFIFFLFEFVALVLLISSSHPFSQAPKVSNLFLDCKVGLHFFLVDIMQAHESAFRICYLVLQLCITFVMNMF